jgi:hypothetical protein
MFHLSFLIICALFVSFWQVPSSREWRGLSPLKSTRADMERLLGPPDVSFDRRFITYYLREEVVFVGFSGNPKCQQKLKYETWDVPKETVTWFRVGLRNPVPVAEAKIDLTKLKKLKGDHDVENHFYYSNTEDGFSIEVSGKYITGYIYGPTSKQESLRCPALER